MKLDSPLINILIKTCLKACKPLIRDFGEIENLQVSSKGPGDFVSSSDKRTEKIIINELQKARPDFEIISEESGYIKNSNSDKKWIIDPIDGTANFLNGIPHFAISIGYEELDEVKCGVIFDPIKNEMFVAEKGNGAYLNNKRIRVSKKKKLDESLIVTGGPRYYSKMREQIFEEYVSLSKKLHMPLRKSGSAALDIAYVSCGRFDGYWQRELNFWDIAAGVVIIKEAGGFVKVFNNKKNVKKKDIFASNSLIHEELIDFFEKKNIE